MGVEYATMSDVRIATDRARFGWVFVRRGLVPDMGASGFLLPRIVGHTEALRLQLSGELIDADEAAAIGFVSAVVPPDDLADAVRAEAERYLSSSPFAVARAKRLAVRRDRRPAPAPRPQHDRAAGVLQVRGPRRRGGVLPRASPGTVHRSLTEPGSPSGLGAFSLAGRTALVTGGCRGIGEMIATGLLDAGAEVVITARSAADLAAAVERLSAHGPCRSVVGDLATTEGCRRLAADVAEQVDGLDILVNNAGATYVGSFEHLPEERWDEVMAVNVALGPLPHRPRCCPSSDAGRRRTGPAGS